MRALEFIPGIGNVFLHKRLANDKSMTFEDKVYQATIGSAYSAVLTGAAMNRNYLAARKVIGTTMASPVIGVGVMLASATAVYPEISGKQYQSAMTGQPTATDTRLVFNSGQGLDYFRF